MAFTHLHLHTEYSLLDGAAHIKRVVDRAKELGMDSLAITDHGSMYGVVEFYKECKAQGIHPVIGCEVYTAARGHLDKEAEKDKRQGHLILLAKTQQGYRNLTKLVSIGHTKGFYYKPRIDKDLLREHGEGIIALSACLAGDVQSRLLKGDYNGAKEEALEFLGIFGEGNFYLEIQDQGLPEEAEILPLMKRLHEETGIPLAATNDVHYVRQEDAEAHDVLLCIQTGAQVDQADRMRFSNDQFYLKSEDEMRKIFHGLPDACDNTHKIAMSCQVDFDFNTLHLPEFQAPDGKTKEEYLRQLCKIGLYERYKKEEADRHVKRLNYELSVIENMGYVEYFLIVWDFINFARNKDIVVGPGRGSAAGSLVAYTLRITDIDPIKYDLIFERFLNPERVSMPDIDIDFCYERRGEVIDYVIEKYGEERVAQIITFGTLKAKAAVRDVARAMNLNYAEADSIAKAIPLDLKMNIDKALYMNPELKDKYDNDQRIRKVLDTAKAVEGMPRHASTHAAGIVISKEPLDSYVPLCISDKGISTQFPMTTIEELGLLKMDFLGLRNLTVIRDALELIERNHGVKIDFSSMDYDDSKVYDMISKGNTQGVFQLESTGMTQFMKNLKPDCFEDIVAGISLYRPGPMASIPTYIANKKNPHKIQYLHPSLEPILCVTYGCMVYQEQVMRIVRDLAGYTFGRSDILRRAMGKKKMDVMLAEKEVFLSGALERGISRKAGEEIFNQMVSFAEYAFNKSHAAAYAVIGYETAYLKAHYPVEFMAALMTSVMGDSHNIAKYIRNCSEMGIDVMPPDVNTSVKKFTAVDGKISFGLLGVKNVGEQAIDEIIEARETKGIPASIFTFIDNLDVSKVNKKAIESLIKAGALDSLEGNRAQKMATYEGLLESAQSSARKNLAGQISLFQINEEDMDHGDTFSHLPDVAEFPGELLNSMEKDMVGVYLRDHPLNAYKEKILKLVTLTADVLMDEEQDKFKDGDQVVMAGIITGKRVLVTKNNKQMAFIQMEDLYGQVELIVFPNVYEKFGNTLREDNIIAVKGKMNCREDEAPKLLADVITEVKSIVEEDSIRLRIPHYLDESYAVKEISKIIQKHRGYRPVIIYMKLGQALKGGKDMCASGSTEFCEEVKALLGAENVKI